MAEAGAQSRNRLPSGVVCFLLTDIEQSTELWDRAPEAMDDAVALHDRLTSATVIAHGGHLLKHRGEGDSTFSVFADPIAGAQAASDLQTQLASAEWPDGVALHVRMGLHVGEAVQRDGDYFGVTVNRAARVRGIAVGGEIALSEAMADVVGTSESGFTLRSGGEFQLRGLARPERISFLNWRPDGGRSALRLLGSLEDAPQAIAIPSFRPKLVAEFVGRSTEQMRLDEAWLHAKGGQATIAVIGGEAGIGKTSVAMRFAARCHSERAVVLWGRCDEHNVVPFQPFAEAFRSLPGTQVWERAAARLGTETDYLGAFLTGVAGMTPRPNESEYDLDDAPARRSRMFEAVAAALRELAAEIPVVLAVDDLQFADEPTEALLRHVVTTNVNSRLLVLVTTRNPVPFGASGARRPLATLGREIDIRRVEMPGLSSDEIASLITGTEVEVGPRDEALAVVLARETGGNPLFLREVIGSLRETGVLARADDQWRVPVDLENIRVPDRVHDVISERLFRLGESTQQLLITASVLGAEFTAPVLEQTTGMSEDDLFEAIDEALHAGFITETDAVDRFRFAHTLTRSGLYNQLSQTRRARMHARAGEAIESLHANDTTAVAAELAHHFARAGGFDRDGRGRRYAVAAARAARADLAFEESARLLGEALANEVAEPLPADERIELLLELGETQWRVGAISDARPTFAQAAAEAVARGNRQAVAHAALGYVGDGVRFWWIELAAVNEEAIGLLEQALELLRAANDPGDIRLTARVMAALAQEIFYVEGSRERRLQLSAEAVAVARASGDPRTLAIVLADRNLAIFDSDHIEERRANAHEVLHIGESLGDLETQMYGYAHRGAAAAGAGDMGDASKDAESAMAIAQQLKQRHYIGIILSCQAMIQQHTGALETCEEMASDAFRLGREQRDPNSLLVYAAQVLAVRHDQDRLEELAGLNDRMAEVFPRIPALIAMSAMTRAQQGQADQARAVLARVVRDGEIDLPRDSVYLPALCCIGETAVALGLDDLAAKAHAALLPYASINALIGAFGSWGSPATTIALLAAHLRMPAEQVDAKFNAAMDQCDRLGSPLFAARTLVYWGEAHWHRAEPGEARAKAERARALAPLGPDLDRRARALLDGRLAPLVDNERRAPRRVDRARGVLSTRGRGVLGRIVRGSDDDTMLRALRSAATQRTLLTALARSYQPTYAYGFAGNIVIELETSLPGETPVLDIWTIEVSAKRARARRGPATPAAVTVRVGAADFARLVAGTLDPVRAFRDARLTVDGDVLVAARIDELFGGAAPV